VQRRALFISCGCLLLGLTALAFSRLAAQSSSVPTSFDVQVFLSSRAAARLGSLSEGIVVDAAYSANPAPGAESHADQIGRIDLGNAKIEISGRPQVAHVAGPHITKTLLAETRGPVLLNVNLYSARRSGPDNILSCDFFDGNLADAVHKTLQLHCSLIDENASTASSGTITPIPSNRAADSYAIYSLLVPGGASDKISPSHVRHWSLADTTVSINEMNPAIAPDGQLKAPPDNVKAFNEALQDFQVRKYQRFQLEAASFHPRPALTLIGDQQITDLRNSGDINSGVAFFSAVYFNNTQTAALVYVNNWCANLCAVGQWVYLEKHGGQWVRRSGIVIGGA
jgi:hypothetical protein